jgi:exodeoxyribonuclease VIII
MTDVHIMIDTETWGQMPDSALRSIGAVTFDPCGDPCGHIHKEQVFYCNVDRVSCEAIGLVVYPETEAWWGKQATEAQDALQDDPWHIRYALDRLELWWQSVGATHLWCNGAGFDEPILRLAYGRIDRRTPWKFWNIRDTRTIWDVGCVNQKDISRAGAPHHALHDARHQAKCVTLAYQRLAQRPPASDRRDAVWAVNVETTDA